MYLYSNDDPELAIGGTVAELNRLAGSIMRLKPGETCNIKALLDKESEPYDRLLSEVILHCNNSSKIKCSTSGGALKLEYPDISRLFVASYFSFFTDETVCGEHCHFDRYFFEEIFHEESVDMVIRCED
ncbi:MAG: hypothetical protein KAI39_12270 [Desulfobulbaceae bacterium]|nr:hypothetical protein [Desulfobulbaceae bacterium]